MASQIHEHESRLKSCYEAMKSGRILAEMFQSYVSLLNPGSARDEEMDDLCERRFRQDHLLRCGVAFLR